MGDEDEEEDEEAKDLGVEGVGSQNGKILAIMAEVHSGGNQAGSRQLGASLLTTVGSVVTWGLPQGQEGERDSSGASNRGCDTSLNKYAAE